MAEDLLSAEELRPKIGTEWHVGVFDVEKGLLRQFTRAVDDQNPLWGDEEYAKKSNYGGILAPLSYVQCIGYEQADDQIMDLMPSAGAIDGRTELESYQLVRPGDTITVTNKLIDVSEREGKKLGKMVFTIFEISYINQRQELVAKRRETIIRYKKEEVKA